MLGLRRAASFRLGCRLGTRNIFSASDNISVAKTEEGIVTLSLDREQGRNSLSRNMLNDISQFLTKIETDSSVRVLIIRSSLEKVFCAGADLKERATMNDAQVEAFVDSLRNTFHAVSQLPFPTIAAIEGAALGGGLELALACDMRIAGQKALMGLPETSLAIVPGAGGTQRLPRIVGVAKAKELIFTATRLSGSEAAAIGLVTECVEAGKATERSEEIARKIVSHGPIALRAAKSAIDQGIERNLVEGLEIEKHFYGHVITTEDRREGLLAFKEKRAPVYTGK